MIYTNCKTEEKCQVLEGHLTKHYKKPTLSIVIPGGEGAALWLLRGPPGQGGSFFLRDNWVVHLADLRGRVVHFPVE